MSAFLREALQERRVAYSELPNGDLFFRRADGQGMFVRPYSDGSYDWSVNAARNDTNLLDFRSPERHRPEEVLQRIDSFMGSVVSGPVFIDTLGMVRHSMDLGMSREEAERVATIARNLVLEMHEAGMDAHEIRNRFAEIHEQLRRERLGSAEPSVQVE